MERVTNLFRNVNEAVVADEKNLDAILDRSKVFSETNPYPVQANLLERLQSETETSELLFNVNQAYPLIHEEVIQLIADFIAVKKETGSAIEKELYKDMDLIDFIDRFIRLFGIKEMKG